jgi:hypothetical protein
MGLRATESLSSTLPVYSGASDPMTTASRQLAEAG